MISIFILLVSSIAIIFLLLKLVKVKQQGRLLQTLRDLLIIMLAIDLGQQIELLEIRQK